jgi:predicted ATPase
MTTNETSDDAVCACAEPHLEKRIVLTGGPGAGKTAVLELIR